MYIRSIAVIFFILFLIESAQGQEWTRDDFNVGSLKIDSPFDSVLSHLGKPNKAKFDANDTNFIGFYYSKLIVFKNAKTNRLASFHIYDTSFVTHRGLRVGDSSDKIKKLYGNASETTKKFWTGWENDYSFHDYSEAKVFHDGDFNFVVFIKNERIVKMLFFFNIVLTYDDYNVQFLKLASPIDSITSHLGIPDSIKSFYEDSGYTGYYYPKLVLWRDDHDSSLCAFDIYDGSFITKRGLRIGDSVRVIEELYGNRDWVENNFSRVGPYDTSFHDYSEITIYGGSKYLIFFTKEQRLVKILSYIGVEE